MEKELEILIRNSDHVTTPQIEQDLKDLYAHTILLKAEIGGVKPEGIGVFAVALGEATVAEAEETLSLLRQILKYRKENNYTY